MKSALLLTAMFSGLCAEVMASPVSHMSHNRTTPVIQPDLHFNADWLDEVSPDQAFLDQDADQAEAVTTGIELDEAIAPQQIAINGNDASGSLRVPEPPPVTLITIGLSFFAVVALWRQARRQRRRLRRRTVVRMRAITAER
jgi:hypothetical protein